MQNVHALVIHGPDEKSDYDKRRLMALEHDKWDFLLDIYDLSDLPRKAIRAGKKVSTANTSTPSARRTRPRHNEPEEVDRDIVEEADHVEELGDVGMADPAVPDGTQDPLPLEDDVDDSDSPSALRSPSL